MTLTGDCLSKLAGAQNMLMGGGEVLRKCALPLAGMLLLACGTSADSNVSTSPSHVVENSLQAVTCPTATHCIAVGWAGEQGGGRARTLIEENTGGGWRIVPSPGIDSGLGSRLRSIACAIPTRCVAVGISSDIGSNPTTLIEESTGNGWTIVPSPNATAFGQATGILSSVACASARDCIAVGSYGADDLRSRTLIEEDTGSGWTMVASPDFRQADPSPPGLPAPADLSSVTCATASHCIAVGTSIGSPSRVTILETFGHGWTYAPGPEIGDDPSLSSMTCASAARCIGVGQKTWGELIPGFTPLIVEKAGDAWTIVDDRAHRGSLSAVTCFGATRCIAVGSSDVWPYGGLIEENTGTGWNVIDSPNVEIGDPQDNYLKFNGVACATASHCVIVGEHSPKSLIAENTGSGWTDVASPNVAAGGSA